MVYENSFIAVVKSNGNILREMDGFVTLPFNSEFTILLKNQNSRKAVVSVEIDGKDVLDGDRLIVNPNSEIELEGFKKGNRVTNRFRFIHKTKEIIKHRGDRVDDGYIRIEVNFEEKVTTERIKFEPVNPDWYWYWNWPHKKYPSITFTDYNYAFTFTSNSGGSRSCNVNLINSGETYDSLPEPKEDEGITVKGSDDVDQNFVRGYTKTLEKESTVIVLRLRGINNKGNSVKKSITVKSKLECPTCGRISPSNFKFCANCGTALQ